LRPNREKETKKESNARLMSSRKRKESQEGEQRGVVSQSNKRGHGNKPGNGNQPRALERKNGSTECGKGGEEGNPERKKEEEMTPERGRKEGCNMTPWKKAHEEEGAKKAHLLNRLGEKGVGVIRPPWKTK